jgi:hypothetical protein
MNLRIRSLRRVLLPLFLLLVLVTNLQSRYRDQFTNLSFNFDRLESDNALEHIIPSWLGGRSPRVHATSRGSEFNCVMTVIELVPDEVDYNYGYPLVEMLTRPIPRALWPDKIYPGLEAAYPIMKKGQLSTTYVATSKKTLLMGPAFTFVGYWYAVGGPVALALAGMATGAFLRMLRTIHDGAPDSQGHTILFTMVIIIGFIEAAATPLSWVFTMPLFLIPLFLLLRWAGKRADQQQPTSAEATAAASAPTRSEAP